MSRVDYGKKIIREYVFRNHLETILNDNLKLKGLVFKKIQSLKVLEGIVKVRVNAIGKIVAVGEYD